MQRDVRWPANTLVDPQVPLKELLLLPAKQRPEIVLPNYATAANARTELAWLAMRFPYVVIKSGDITYNREVAQATRRGWTTPNLNQQSTFTGFGFDAHGSWTADTMTQQLSLATTVPTAPRRRVEQPYPLAISSLIARDDSRIAQKWRSAICSYRMNGVAIYARWDPRQCSIEEFARIADGALLPFGEQDATKQALEYGLAVRWCTTIDFD